MILDFRSKFLMSSVISVACISGNIQQIYPYVYYLIIAIPFLLLLLEKKYKVVILCFMWMAIANVLVYYLLTSEHGVLSFPALLISGVVMRLLPGSMMGYYALTSTTMSDLVQSLKKMKVPDMFIIPISVMFRFFYSTKEDYQIVCDAMYMHGLTTFRLLKHPTRMLEYRLVPLLMVVVQTADHVAISAMTRGMRVGVARTSISSAKLRFIDYLSFLGMAGVIFVYLRSMYA